MTLELIGGYTIRQCASGLEAIKTAEEFLPQLFLLDVMMPDMGGEETWRRLKSNQELGEVPVVFMTAKAEISNKERLVEAGARAVIVKPFDPAELCSELEAIWSQM